MIKQCRSPVVIKRLRTGGSSDRTGISAQETLVCGDQNVKLTILCSLSSMFNSEDGSRYIEMPSI